MNYLVVLLSLRQDIEKLKYEVKSKIYSFVIYEGVDCFYEASDKGDDDCLYEFLMPRANHELCYIDNGEAFENSSYDDIMEHIKYSKMQCTCFKKLFVKFSKTVEELVLIFYNSIQDYYDSKSINLYIQNNIIS